MTPGFEHRWDLGDVVRVPSGERITLHSIEIATHEGTPTMILYGGFTEDGRWVRVFEDELR